MQCSKSKLRQRTALKREVFSILGTRVFFSCMAKTPLSIYILHYWLAWNVITEGKYRKNGRHCTSILLPIWTLPSKTQQVSYPLPLILYTQKSHHASLWLGRSGNSGKPAEWVHLEASFDKFLQQLFVSYAFGQLSIGCSSFLVPSIPFLDACFLFY
jgi:hypothetical protein